MDIAKMEEKISKLSNSLLPSNSLEKGISIIVPVYNNYDFLKECLDSIENQIITDAKYEVIFVLNGIFKEELEYLTNKLFEDLEILILINDEASAGSARNLGMHSAKYSHITFVDVDDYISEQYVQANYNLIKNDTITISQIHDVDENTIVKDNFINLEVIKNEKPANVSILKLNRVSSITVCKVIPKGMAILQQFRGHLKSGEDTVFYSELFVNNRPKLKVVPLNDNAIYYRRITKNSISRKKSSYDFSVSQRIDILEILDELLSKVSNPTLLKFLKTKYNAQISFMNRYLHDSPEEQKKVVEMIKLMSFNHFSFSRLNNGLAKMLVISYCFPPYNDTSATVISKRLLMKDEPFDVVYNNMSQIRTKEKSLNNMISHLYDQRKMVNITPSFSSMYYLNNYVDVVFNFYSRNIDKYSSIYSRAMFPISHVPPFFIKLLNPKVKWIAEFSDPLLIDIESNTRYSALKNKGLLTALQSGVLGDFTDYVDDNLFNVSELIPFALADTLVFTNVNQLEYMINRFPELLKTSIRNKSIISKHPTLPYKYYQECEFNYKLEDSIINMAYFGNFYSRRSYSQFLDLVSILNESYNQIFKLHLFTNKNQLTEEQLADLDNNLVTVNEYLSYSEFLNATTKFDVLLLNDSYTQGDKPLNPYLPSKLSDYLGSNNSILSFTEKNSIMSEIENEKVYKIDLTLFQKQMKNKNLHKNVEIMRLVESLQSNKDFNNKRNIKINNDDIVLTDKNQKIIMHISNDLILKNISNKDWLIQPRELPITKDKQYSIRLNNESDNIRRFKLKSFYSVPKVIDIIIKQDDIILSKDCISNFRKTFTDIDIPPNSEFTIQLKYRKDYQKEGFIKAGRIRIQES